MPSNKYRVAVVGGVGTWGQNYLHAYAQHDQCDLLALVDPAADRRQSFADHYGVKHVYDDVDDLLADEVPDIVSVITPVSHTARSIIACAEAGVKAISSEKPLAVSLRDADLIVQTCTERGVILGVGTLLANQLFKDTAAWVQEGNIGELKSAAIPLGIDREVSGSGCVTLTMLRLLAGKEVEWVEGHALTPEPGYRAEGATDLETDCPVYGRLGLGDQVVCEIPKPETGRGFGGYKISVRGEKGQVWWDGRGPVIVQGEGAKSFPVYPDFLNKPQPGPLRFSFAPVIEPLIQAVETGESVWPNEYDALRALETAIAFKLSSHQDGKRITLPLADRELKVYPHPYRLTGGDVYGWGKGFGGNKPPDLETFLSRFK